MDNELQLIEAFRGGDQGAFEELIIAYEKKIFSI